VIRSVNQTPLYELLSPENNVVYEVPAYQREYSWGKEQWDALFDDLIEEPPGGGHFLGTIICVNKTEDTTRQSVLELVDGQQRMTTLSLLLLAIYKQFLRIDESLDEDEKADLANLRRMLCLRNPTRQRISLQTQNSNHADFKWVLSDAGFDLEQPKINYVGIRRISKALQHFVKRLDEYLKNPGEMASEPEAKILFAFLERVKQSILVKLEVENHTDAFVLFESLNNRGLPLTPIDLIKTSLLSTADKLSGVGVDLAYKTWTRWLEVLGDDYGNQERFFRQFYNAFKTDWNLSRPNVPVATRSKLIQIYESLIREDLPLLIDRMDIATEAYGRILGNLPPETKRSRLDSSLRNLPRAQGVPGYMLMLFLIVNSERFELEDKRLAEISDFLTNFFVRRNLTNTPPTYDLDRIFVKVIDDLIESTPKEVGVINLIRKELSAVSASDSQFLQQLKGPLYEENTSVTRYILTALAESSMTDESFVDLWHQEKSGDSKDRFVWTIEHILPQGENLPSGWIEMLGGNDSAQRIQRELVHTIGNLTISGYNSTLGNKSFVEKRDRVNADGRFVGFKNNLNLNSDLAGRESWDDQAILERTENLTERALSLFKLA
jgi:hypothetical protein